MEKKSHVLERNHFVHADVEGLGGHFVDELEVEADADAFNAKVMGEETVVVAPSASDAVTLVVESHAWYDDEVEIACIGIVLWLHDIEVAHGEMGVFGVFDGDDVVAHYGGQDDGFFQVPFFEEGLRLHFIGEGAIEHDSFGTDEVWMLFQLGHYFFRLFKELLFGMLFFQGLDEGAQFFFVHSDSVCWVVFFDDLIKKLRHLVLNEVEVLVEGFRLWVAMR